MQGKAIVAAMLWLVCVLAGVLATGPAGAQALHVDLMLTHEALDGPPSAAPVERRVSATSDASLRIALPRRSAPYWLRLTLDGEVQAGDDRVLVLEGARSLGPVMFYPPGAAPQQVRGAGEEAPSLLQRGWALRLPEGWPQSSVAWLRVNAASTEPLHLRLVPAGQLAREQRERARGSVAAFTVLLLMSIAVLVVYVSFRDLLYLSYAGYLASIALYTVMVSGDATEMPGLAGLAAQGFVAAWALATLAIALQLVFTRRILELDRLMPRAARAIGVLFWIHVVLLAALLLGRELVHDWYYLVINALLIACAPAVLLLALLARRHGAAYATFYFFGWAPLLVVAMLTAANQLGALDAPWAEHVLPLAAVIESGVLAFALSRHAAHRHRIALFAQQTQERDPLTGALNGDALMHMLDSWAQLGSFGARGYCVLLVDLDNFSELNKRHGRAVGDAILQQALSRVRAVVRPDDVIGRLDGDSFAIVGECDRGDSGPFARRLGDALCGRPFRIDGDAIAVSASVGLAFSVRGESAHALMQRARDALLRSRRMGGNAVSLADDAQAAPAEELVDA